jgi:hypothetical protein
MATIRAPIADVGALHHGLVALRHSGALIGTLAADGGAQLARIHMAMRSAEHEIGARLADLGAVHQEPDVAVLGMMAAQSKAVCYGFHADAVAVQAVLDAGSHLRSHHLVMHGASPFPGRNAVGRPPGPF